MIEAGVPFRDFSLDNPIRRHPRGQHDDRPDGRPVRPAGGRPAPGHPARYLAAPWSTCRAASPSAARQVVDLWGRQLDAVESQDFAKVDTEIDWVIKGKLFSRYQDRYGMGCPIPDRQLDLPITTSSGPRRVRPAGLAWPPASPPTRRSTPRSVHAAADHPRNGCGEFIAAAQEGRPDFTVDWVHLKLNDQASAPCCARIRSAQRRAGGPAHRQHDGCTARLRLRLRFQRGGHQISEGRALDELGHRAPVHRTYPTAERIRANVAGYGEQSGMRVLPMFEWDRANCAISAYHWRPAGPRWNRPRATASSRRHAPPWIST